MSDNDSFIDEVTEEVRRDKLYLFLRRYGWIPLGLIAAVIFVSIYLEFRSSANRVEAEKLGDFLSKSLALDIDNTEAISLDSLNAIDSGSVVSLMLKARVLENSARVESAILVYEKILETTSIPVSIRDFIKFKLLLLIKNDPIRTEALLVELINPDSSFNLLALEQKILRLVNQNNLEEAISNIDLLIENPDASQAMSARVTQIKNAININDQ
jgi:hypothetical protein